MANEDDLGGPVASGRSSLTTRTSVLDSFDLDGSVVLVTGASKNIGASLATAYAAVGATVVGVARSAGPLEERFDAIRRQTGGELHTVPGDVGSAADVQSIVDRALDLCGRVDVLVNNAYTNTGSWGSSKLTSGKTDSVGGDVLEMDDAAWDECIAVNVMGPWRLTRLLARGMRERQAGSIINVLSTAGFLPTYGYTTYGSTKAALWSMTRSLAVQLAPHVRVNALVPGLVHEAGSARTEYAQQITRKIPFGRMGHPDEMVGAALYLASDASSYTTGAVIHADGGRAW